MLSVEQLLILEDVVQYLVNMCLYDVWSFILTESNTNQVQEFDQEKEPFQILYLIRFLGLVWSFF